MLTHHGSVASYQEIIQMTREAMHFFRKLDDIEARASNAVFLHFWPSWLLCNTIYWQELALARYSVVGS